MVQEDLWSLVHGTNWTEAIRWEYGSASEPSDHFRLALDDDLQNVWLLIMILGILTTTSLSSSVWYFTKCLQAIVPMVVYNS